MKGISLAVKMMALALVAACATKDKQATDNGNIVYEAPVNFIGGLGPLHVAESTLLDSEGRQVLLHGTGMLSLGDYYQGDPSLPAAPQITADDWDAMAAYGFSAVRTVVSWSALEPEPGVYDESSFARLGEAIDQAARRGIYTIIDVHQDAWGKFIASPRGIDCPENTEPAIGWDGAPEWATITDGESTCRPIGFREGSPAVLAAFSNFYRNRDGIADAFVELWGRLATEYAGRPGVGGFDLLNEPFMSLPANEMVDAYTELMRRTIAAIRTAEETVGAPSTPIFLEPVVLYPLPGNMPDPAGLDDANLVFSPHIYPNALTRAQMLAAHLSGAKELNAPLWIGEFSFGNIGEAGLAEIREFLQALDRVMAGNSWWVWQTACGDPHYVGVPHVDPSADHPPNIKHHLKSISCPSGEAELNMAFLELAGRTYPRLSPGRLDELESNLSEGSMFMSGSQASPGQRLIVWLLERDSGLPEVLDSTGVVNVTIEPYGKGAYLTAETDGEDYSLAVGYPQSSTVTSSVGQ